MIRILLPLAAVAAIFFGPMFTVETTDSLRGTTASTVTGDYFISGVVDCLREMKPPIGEECASTGKLNDSLKVGTMISYASILAVGAGALSVLGLLPFVGRLTSIVTILAGLGLLGSIGLLALTMMGTPEGLPGLQWGAYVAGAAGLLTLISGLSGVRGR